MQIPTFGKPQNQDPYTIPQPGASKKTVWLMIGGAIVVVILLLVILFSGGDKGGQPQLKTTIDHTADAVAVLDEYVEETSSTGLKNDLALAQILLRGNYHAMIETYKTAFPRAKNISGSPKPDEKAVEKLDRAKRNNLLDSEIVTVLKANVEQARTSLKEAKPFFQKPTFKQALTEAEEDLFAVQEILNRAR